MPNYIFVVDDDMSVRKGLSRLLRAAGFNVRVFSRTFQPMGTWVSFFMGPGIEIEKEENFSVFRIGMGYEIEIGNEWDFKPEFIYDL